VGVDVETDMVGEFGVLRPEKGKENVENVAGPGRPFYTREELLPAWHWHHREAIVPITRFGTAQTLACFTDACYPGQA
jgi:hypothetical protein